MPRTDLLMGHYTAVEPLVSGVGTELVVARTPEGKASVLLLGHTAEALAAQWRVLDEIAGGGVPAVVEDLAPHLGRPALRMALHPGCAPLDRVAGLSPAMLRAGLVTLLRALARAHGRGHVHGAISTEDVLVDPDGGFWIVGWDMARPVGAAPVVDGFDPVAHDVRLLGGPLAGALRRATGVVGDARDTLPRGPDRDFQRVLSRLLAPDARDAFTSAGEVLADLGERLTLDPWESVPCVHDDRVLEQVRRMRAAWSETAACGGGTPPASIDILGPHRAGRSRVLRETAAALRAEGALVLRAEASGCAWGGLRTFARQLLQITGRKCTALAVHQETLETIAFGPAGPTDGGVAAAADALVALVRVAFAGDDGALLLDDLDEMPLPALEVWRAATRRLAAMASLPGDTGAPDRKAGALVLVATSVSLPPGHDDVERVTLRLHDWDTATVARFLDGVLEDMATARAAAPVIRALAGSLPGDIVDVLRDLERGGSLCRVRGRWRFEIPLHALSDWFPSEGESVRRTLHAAGRDTLALVEALAVAGEPLSRIDCGLLSELSGAALWQAGERGEAAGLLVQDGASWRLPSERIRRRVIAGLGDARLRSLHREVLLLWSDRRPGDVASLAWHARACRHADASALTLAAVEELERKGRSDSAIAHLEDAERLLGEPDWGRARWMWRAELLRVAGRLADGAALLEALLRDDAFSAEEKALASLRLAEMHYESRQWEAALGVPLPDLGATADRLAEFRYYRAAAFAQCFQIARARREARLAAAEWGLSPEPPEVARARHEYGYKLAFHTGDKQAARRALLEKMRLGRRHAISRTKAFDLLRYSFLWTHYEPGVVVPQVLSRARTVIESAPEGARHLRAWLEAMAASRAGGDRAPEMYERFMSACRWSRSTGVACLARRAIASRLLARVCSGRYDGRDQSRLNDLAVGARSAPLTDLHGWSYQYATVLFDLGRQPDLEHLLRRVESLPNSDRRTWLVRRAVFRGRLMWTASEPETLVALPQDSVDAIRLREPGADALGAEFAFADGGESSPALIAAWAIRRGPDGCELIAPEWSIERMEWWLSQKIVQPGQVALALALGLWWTERLSPDQWRLVRAVRAVYDGAWFPSLRWQASLMDGRAAWFEGAYRAAQAHHERAREQAAWLRAERFGEWGRREYALAARVLDATRFPVSAPGGIGARGAAPVRPSAKDDTGVGIDARPVAALRTLPAVLLRADSIERLAAVLEAGAGWRPLGLGGAAVDVTTDRLVVYLPERLPAEDLRRAADAARRYVADGRRVVVASTWTLADLDGLRPPASALVSSVRACDLSLRAAEWRPVDRHRNFAAHLRAAGTRLRMEHAARVEVALHAWPGGDVEMARLAAIVASQAAGCVTPDDLYGAGLPAGSAAREVDRRVLLALPPPRCAAVSDLADELVEVARRTLQRRLRVLVAQGLLRVSGSARATRYSFVD